MIGLDTNVLLAAEGKIEAKDDTGKASCHSDYVDTATAEEHLVPLGLGSKTSESVI